MAGLLHDKDYDWDALEDMEKNSAHQSEDDSWEQAQMAIDIAHDVFVRHDVDSSGALDANEMATVVLTALLELGSDVPPDIEDVRQTCSPLCLCFTVRQSALLSHIAPHCSVMQLNECSSGTLPHALILYLCQSLSQSLYLWHTVSD